MLALSGKFIESGDQKIGQKLVAKLSDSLSVPMPLRKRMGYIIRNAKDAVPSGYSFYLSLDQDMSVPPYLETPAPLVHLADTFSYLADGDVIRLNPVDRAFRVLYRVNSMNNYFLLTERCNHYCLMCSQPPKNIDDSWIVSEVMQAIPLISPATQEIGFTGGEPTLLGDDFINILQMCKNYLPNTAIHILTNGRTFKDIEFTKKYAAINHPDMMVGIPIYADISSLHNYVVQAENAFDETIRGILNLKRFNQQVEIRVVLHKQTYKRLPQLAEFIVRNLTFVDHVALMGLEHTGFTKANMPVLWIDPMEYQQQLHEAVSILSSYGIRTSIYNHQLCVLDRRVWKYARKSISDWKNEYLPECESCNEKQNCGGFFSSTISKHSDFIRALA